MMGPDCRSETLGLVSGPVTYQPSDLGQQHAIFSYLLILIYKIEIKIPTLHPFLDYWESYRR